jgi:hypothetical protein
MTTRDGMVAQATILARPGWSKGLVTKLLGEPDARRKSYLYPTYLRLYSLERVQTAELSTLFLVAQRSLKKRKAGGKKAVQTKTKRLMEPIITFCH